MNIGPTTQNAAEATRAEYRPAEIKILFVGESPPAGGTFFYYGNSNLARYTREAFETAFDRRFSGMNAFLDFFKQQGCYLDDLCLVPVKNMNKTQRNAERQRGADTLAERIQAYDPDYIIIVMIGIEGHVVGALYRADLQSIPRTALPFPSHGNQSRYVNELADTLKDLQDGDLLVKG